MSSNYGLATSLMQRADDLEYYGNRLIQSRTFAEIALTNAPQYSNQREEDRADDTEYFARKAYRLGQEALDYLIG